MQSQVLNEQRRVIPEDMPQGHLHLPAAEAGRGRQQERTHCRIGCPPTTGASQQPPENWLYIMTPHA